MCSIHVVSARAEGIAGAPGGSLGRYVVTGLAGLRQVLESLLATPPPAAYLDLSGHSTRAGRLLRLGADVIDMLEPRIARFFEHLAHECLLARLNVRGLRLLGCQTAVDPTGRRTLRMLARTLGLPVFGTTRTLFKSHYDEHGFDPAFESVLVEARWLGPPHAFEQARRGR
jgi:hypothetical protein